MDIADLNINIDQKNKWKNLRKWEGTIVDCTPDAVINANLILAALASTVLFVQTVIIPGIRHGKETKG